MARNLLADADESDAPNIASLTGAIAAGRYEGTVKRESDDATFLRAIVIHTPTDTQIPIEIYDQLGGSIPQTPQISDTAFIFGPIIFLSTSDNVAARKFICLVVGNFMLSISTSDFHDNRPSNRLTGLLRKQ